MNRLGTCTCMPWLRSRVMPASCPCASWKRLHRGARNSFIIRAACNKANRWVVCKTVAIQLAAECISRVTPGEAVVYAPCWAYDSGLIQ